MKRVWKLILAAVIIVASVFALVRFGLFERLVDYGRSGRIVKNTITEGQGGNNLGNSVEGGAEDSAGQAGTKEGPYKFGKCTFPLKYRIGEIDPRFKISRADVVAAAGKAETMWEAGLAENAYENSEDGTGLPINLIYDERQAETDYLNKQFTDLTDKKVKYDYLRREYDSLVSNMNASKDSFESLRNLYESFLTKFNIKKAQFEKDKRIYDERVADWNSRGVITEEEYKSLQEEGTRLRSVAADLNADFEDLKNIYSQLEAAKDSFNMVIGKVNAVAELVNKTAESLNERVVEYNHLSEGRDEFVTGYYKQSPTEKQIDIFQFGSKEELVLIIAHELGHALGMGHATTSESIMYPKTTDKVKSASAEDLRLLREACAM